MSRSLSSVPLFLAVLAAPLAVLAQTPEIPEEPPAPPSGTTPKQQPAKTPPRTEPVDVESEPPAAGQGAARPAAQPAQTGAAAAGAVGATRVRKPSGRLAPSPTGETGLLRVVSAEAMAPKTVRLTFGLDFFSVGSMFGTDDSHSRVGGTLSVSMSPINYLEFWLSTRAQSNGNSRTQPQLLQSQGDLTLGVKGFYPVADLATVGLDLQLNLLSGIGDTSFDFGASGLTLRGLLTADFQKATEKIPLRAHLNFGVAVDNSHSLLTKPLSNAERFALGISDFDRFLLGIAVEVPVKYVTPYLEYTIEFPFGYLATPGVILQSSALRVAQTPGDEVKLCDPSDEEACGRPAYQRAIPQRITPGVRVTAIPDLTLDLAVEIGITPSMATGVLATPPYNIVFLATYAFDPWAEKGHGGPPIAVPVLVPEITEVAPKPTKGEVSGIVRSKEGAEISGAVIAFDRAPPVATSPSGLFKSHEMEPGPVSITILKDGFDPATASAEVAIGEVAEIEVKMTPQIREGVIRGKIVDEKDKPIPGIAIDVKGPSNSSANTGDDGTFEVKAVAGKYSVEASAEAYLTKGREFELKGGETMSMEMVLRKRPKQVIAEISRDMIVVKQSVHFVTGEARLAPDAAAVLDNVVDVIVRNKQVKKIRVEGHTDNVGNDDANLQLSRDRAASVVQYLVDQGIDRSRLTAEGYGASRPIAPNLTRRGREQNRRVEFHIVE